MVEEIPIPGYIEIESIGLDHEPNALGITDAWVYVNNEMIGVFELPAKFPVIAEGTSEITIFTGIKVNGISSTRSYYPYYETYKETIDIQPSETTKVSPKVGYESWSEIAWYEKFEKKHSFVIDEGSDTDFVIETADKFEGASCGAIYLGGEDSSFVAFTEQLVRPNITNNPNFIELNFKCNNEFLIGVSVYYGGYEESEFIIKLNHASDWKKIYIDLYNTLSKYPENTPYKIFIAALIEDDLANAAILIDDFKIVQSSLK